VQRVKLGGEAPETEGIGDVLEQIGHQRRGRDADPKLSRRKHGPATRAKKTGGNASSQNRGCKIAPVETPHEGKVMGEPGQKREGIVPRPNESKIKAEKE